MALILPNSVFLHIPKAGGTTVRRLIERLGLDRGETGTDQMREVNPKHSCYEWFRDETEGLTLFSSVRKTLPWYRSVWCHKVRTGGGSGISSDENHRPVFADWVRHVTQANPGDYGGFLINAFRGSDPILIETDVDLFGELKMVLEQVGEEFTWPNPDECDLRNVSSDSEKEAAYWTSELIDLVESVEGPGEYPELFMWEYADNFVSRESGVMIGE